MLKMRLQRVGRKHDPSFRIIVQEHTRGPRAGKYVDLLGHYEVKKGNVKIDGEKAKLWISRGTQVSGTVWNLLVSEGIVEGKKVNVLPKKTAPKKEEEVAEVKKEGETAEEGASETIEAPASESETPTAEEETPAEETKA
ncbi:MAG TPA: 30S ribosomal protein S16 [Candidatus Paceibacterota bacterium]|nr:30S ribosomal protein S16 [Candidatus Paceibacterota bacterium]